MLCILTYLEHLGTNNAFHYSAQNNPASLNQFRDSALQTLRVHTYLRTDQFQVTNSLDGLEERFRVNDREALADALHERRQALDQFPSKWHPEILFLLLEISDQPTFHSRLSDLDDLREKGAAEDVSLRWEDIAAEDGWNEDAALWDNIEYNDNSDDESFRDDIIEDPDTTHDSIMSDAAIQPPRNLVLPEQATILFEDIKDSQNWRVTKPSINDSGRPVKVAVSELDAIHEVLFMMQGLETSLFDENCTPVSQYQMQHMQWETHRALLNAFAEEGRHLLVLRQLVCQEQNVPHLQAFQASVEARLSPLDGKIVEIQTKLGCPEEDVNVSLSALQGDLRSVMEPLVSLAKIVEEADRNSKQDLFRYLDGLYVATNTAQLSGNSAVYEFLARIFLESFNVYLRPIRDWMCQGKLSKRDKIFFVVDSAETTSSGNIWKDRFKLRKEAQGKIHAPQFLQPAAGKIFRAGKTVVVLNKLGKHGMVSHLDQDEDLLTFEEVCPPDLELAPFSTLFEISFEKWIGPKYGQASTTLRDVIFNDWALSSSLDILQYVYLHADGSLSATFLESVFSQIDTGFVRWYDHHTLTGLAQDVWDEHFESARISVTIDEAGRTASLQSARETVRSALPSIQFSCRLSWVIQMIISAESLDHYQSVYTLLVQLRRAIYILNQPKILANYWTDHEHWAQQTMYYKCRQKFIWFCTSLQSYISTLVLRPAIQKMRRDISQAPDIDAMISIHDNFTKSIINEACLGSRLSPIHSVILDVLDLALKLEFGRSEPSSYEETLADVRTKFEKHLRFICEGLRSVARATSDAQSIKWNILTEMLETGRTDE